MGWNVNPHLEEAHELLTPLLGLVGDDGPVGLPLHAPQAHSCLGCSGDRTDVSHRTEVLTSAAWSLWCTVALLMGSFSMFDTEADL